MNTNDLSTEMDNMNANDEGNFWNPETIGDYIQGECLSIKNVKGKYGPALIIKIRDIKQGPISYFCPTMLQEQIYETSPDNILHKNIGIKFFGIPEGKEYKIVKMVVHEMMGIAPVHDPFAGAPEIAPDKPKPTDNFLSGFGDNEEPIPI